MNTYTLYFNANLTCKQSEGMFVMLYSLMTKMPLTQQITM